MPQLTLVLMLVGAFIVVLGLFMDISAHPKAITTATSYGRAPGPTANAPQTLAPAFMQPMWGIAAPPSTIRKAAAQSGGIATGSNPGIIRPASIERIAPQAFAHGPFNPGVSNSAQ
jgi:hypothetical protein